MVRLPAPTFLAAVALAAALAGCGVKGPLVPAKKGGDTAPPPPPPAATTAPEIPSATLPSNPQPAP
jgi:predicted small lipoprotein YifL